MQNLGTAYTNLVNNQNRVYEVKVRVDGTDYGQDQIYSLVTKRRLFESDTPTIGNAVAGEIDLVMDDPGVTFSRMAQIIPYFRPVGYSGWVQKGVYFINTREIDEETGKLTIHGSDALRKSEQPYPSSSLSWNANSPNAYSVVSELAGFLGVTIDSSTATTLRATARIVNFPAQYTIRETLKSIAAMYGGNFIMSDTGQLKLVGFADIPAETYYLVTETGNYITFGGTRILLRSE